MTEKDYKRPPFRNTFKATPKFVPRIVQLWTGRFAWMVYDTASDEYRGFPKRWRRTVQRSCDRRNKWTGTGWRQPAK